MTKRLGKKPKPKCFAAGTKISTKDGFKNIEHIKAGDYVWSENPETHEKALKKVKKIFVREKDSIVRLSINGEAIRTTAEHPFYVEGQGFTEAKALNIGDKVRLKSGETAEVTGIEEEHLKEPIKVYNFEVEDLHTYYVSEQQVLVHNTCGKVTKTTSTTLQLTQSHKKPNYVGKVKSGNGKAPPNFSPKGAGRKGAFREAKRASGIPVSQHPENVRAAENKANNSIPGREYVFKDSKNVDQKNSIVIREHFGHEYPDNPTQNRGNHFNDIYNNHYDY